LQGLHRAPPQQLDWGPNWSLCCEEEEEDLHGVDRNWGTAMCDHSGLETRSIVSLCIPGMRTADPLDRQQMVDPLDQ
jgi:hypothetical protein